MKASEKHSQDTKWVFLKKGTCSRTMFYILNREFDNNLVMEESAADPLAGGIMQHGYQCGLLWGSALAMGAESYRRTNGSGSSVALAITATQHIIEAFTARTGSTDCEDILEADLTQKGSTLKLLVTGKFISCFKIADKWAPEAIKAAEKGLSAVQSELPQKAKSCASELIRKMGGSEKEVAIVAGLAGGVGLSGGGCGALAAAIWMNTLTWCRENPGKSGYSNPRAKETLEAYLMATDYEFECSKVCGQKFKSIDDHTEFLDMGGCKTLIDALAGA